MARLRVVRDPQDGEVPCYWFRVSTDGDAIEFCTAESKAGTYVALWAPVAGEHWLGLPDIPPTPRRVALWADLYANPRDG